MFDRYSRQVRLMWAWAEWMAPVMVCIEVDKHVEDERVVTVVVARFPEIVVNESRNSGHQPKTSRIASGDVHCRARHQSTQLCPLLCLPHFVPRS